MPHAWFYYVFPLMISIVFVIAAVAMRRQAKRGARHAEGNASGISSGCFSLVFGGVGIVVAGAILFSSPPPWQRQHLFDHVFGTPADQIEQFVILAATNEFKPLTKTQVVIDDLAQIARIAEILNTSREVLPDHPRAKWTAVIEMQTRDGTYYFTVRAPAFGDENGTLVSPKTKPQSDGWNLGDFRADGLDQILDDAVDAAGTSDG